MLLVPFVCLYLTILIQENYVNCYIVARNVCMLYSYRCNLRSELSIGLYILYSNQFVCYIYMTPVS